MSLYVDSSAWYASVDRDDVDHERAVAVLDSNEPKVSSDHVLVELWRLLAHRVGWTIADRAWVSMLAGDMHIEIVGREDLERALQIRERYPDQAFSLVDCTSFVVMERLRIERVATFDDDFAIYRHGARRDKAFQLVR